MHSVFHLVALHNASLGASPTPPRQARYTCRASVRAILAHVPALAYARARLTDRVPFASAAAPPMLTKRVRQALAHVLCVRAVTPQQVTAACHAYVFGALATDPSVCFALAATLCVVPPGVAFTDEWTHASRAPGAPDTPRTWCMEIAKRALQSLHSARAETHAAGLAPLAARCAFAKQPLVGSGDAALAACARAALSTVFVAPRALSSSPIPRILQAEATWLDDGGTGGALADLFLVSPIRAASAVRDILLQRIRCVGYGRATPTIERLASRVASMHEPRVGCLAHDLRCNLSSTTSVARALALAISGRSLDSVRRCIDTIDLRTLHAAFLYVDALLMPSRVVSVSMPFDQRAALYRARQQPAHALGDDVFICVECGSLLAVALDFVHWRPDRPLPRFTDATPLSGAQRLARDADWRARCHTCQKKLRVDTVVSAPIAPGIVFFCGRAVVACPRCASLSVWPLGSVAMWTTHGTRQPFKCADCRSTITQSARIKLKTIAALMSHATFEREFPLIDAPLQYAIAASRVAANASAEIGKSMRYGTVSQTAVARAAPSRAGTHDLAAVAKSYAPRGQLAIACSVCTTITTHSTDDSGVIAWVLPGIAFPTLDDIVRCGCLATKNARACICKIQAVALCSRHITSAVVLRYLAARRDVPAADAVLLERACQQDASMTNAMRNHASLDELFNALACTSADVQRVIDEQIRGFAVLGARDTLRELLQMHSASTMSMRRLLNQLVKAGASSADIRSAAATVATRARVVNELRAFGALSQKPLFDALMSLRTDTHSPQSAVHYVAARLQSLPS